MSDRYLARWRGGEYEASPDAVDDGLRLRLYRADAAPGFDELGSGRHRRVVPAAEVDRLLYVRDVGEWRGQPVHVVGEQDSGLLVLCTGGSAPAAAAAGFRQLDRGVWLAVAPLDEVAARRDEVVVLW